MDVSDARDLWCVVNIHTVVQFFIHLSVVGFITVFLIFRTKAIFLHIIYRGAVLFFSIFFYFQWGSLVS